MMIKNNISRRTLLVGASLLIAGSARAEDTDVVIIGAGSAGIAAARQLNRLGKRSIIIEARQRAGGRLYTDMSLGQPFDGGGAYIHFAEKNPWREIAAEQNVETTGGLRLWSGSIAYRNGVALEGDEAIRRSSMMRLVSAAYDEVDEDDDMSLAQAVSKAEQGVRDASRIQAQMAAGEEYERISVADWQRLEGGQNLLVRGGYGALAEKAAAPLNVRFGVRASAIDWSGQGVVVTTDKGPIRARKVIVTVPVGVLKAGSIKFTPALPRSTNRALDGLRMGALSKVALRFGDDRFGFRPHQFLAEIGDPSRAMTFEAWPAESNLVIGVFGGDYARGLARQGESAAIDHVLERFLKIAGADARKTFQSGKLVGWSEDQFSHGSYAVVLPGHIKSRDALAAPIGERIWFAGEATAGVYSMTAGGAYLAGRETADKVASVLSTSGLR